ncbi:MAG: hypothetical protein AAFR59_08435, partial [Bacteroidota bacterium]
MKKSLYLYILVLAGMFLGGHIWAQNVPTTDALTALKRGIEALQYGEYEKAVQYFNEAEKQDKYIPYLYALRAQAYIQTEAYASADLDLTRALKLYYDYELDGSQNLALYSEVSLSRKMQKALQAYNMYYQRANVRHHLNQRQPALTDLQMSLKLNPSFDPAARYQVLIAQKKPPEKINSIFPSNTTSNTEGNQAYGLRPEGLPTAQETNPDEWQASRDLYTGVRTPRNRRERKQLEAWQKDRAFKEGLKYEDLSVGYATQDYITIKSVQLSSRATFVTFEAENNTEETFNLRLIEKMYITDRSGQISRQLDMTSARNISTRGDGGTEVRPGKRLQFVVIFQPLPDDMHYINIIEGDRKDGQEWNF